VPHADPWHLDAQVALGYFRVFLATMRREWFGIDRLRLDKFMMLVRKFMQQTFVHLRNANWCAWCHNPTLRWRPS
jgi:ribosomal RNA-processing protein 1